MMKVELSWINTSRAIGMFCVYIFHSEIYSLGKSPSGYLFTPFFMAVFYFISGYLFYASNKGINERIIRILSKMLWPYFLFCSLIYFPKMCVRGMDIFFCDYIMQIAGGFVSWFIASLIVVQLLVLSLYKWIKNPLIWLAIGFISFIIVHLLKDGGDNSPWFCLTALQVLPIFALGGVYGRYEKSLNFIHNWWILLPLASLYLILVSNVIPVRLINDFDDDMLFIKILLTLLGTVFVVAFAKKFPPIRLLQFLGRNTLPMYFMSGGFPLLISIIFKQYAAPSVWTSSLVAILSLAIALTATYLINKYLPFMLDLTCLKTISFFKRRSEGKFYKK